MRGDRAHQYRISTQWTGNQGTGTSSYQAYSRDHVYLGEGKSQPILASSDPSFRGDPARYNPEELLVAALSSCHMLWVLHLCADAGIVVMDYVDDATGDMVEHADGSGEFTRVLLRPRMRITDTARTSEALAIHDRAHELCFLARSMRFAVAHEPVVLT